MDDKNKAGGAVEFPSKTIVTSGSSTYAVGRGGGSYESYLLDRTLEKETRSIMAAMGGRQPTDEEWRYLFDAKRHVIDTAVEI